jgi:Cdc6-like AAA superfamily ATPase
LDFALRVGFDPRLCQPYRAQTKGKVERFLRYAQDNFLPSVRPTDLHDLADSGANRTRQARLRLPACLEDIDYRHPRGLDRSLLRSLATGDWLRARQNVLITGPTGVGKTFIGNSRAVRGDAPLLASRGRASGTRDAGGKYQENLRP